MARYGGEEFVCLMPESTLEGGMGNGEELCMAVERLAIAHATSPTATMVTISIGAAATIPDAEEGALHLLQRADEALYSAKLAGRNRVNAAPDITSGRPKNLTHESSVALGGTQPDTGGQDMV